MKIDFSNDVKIVQTDMKRRLSNSMNSESERRKRRENISSLLRSSRNENGKLSGRLYINRKNRFLGSDSKLTATIEKLKKDVYAKASAKAAAEGKTLPPLESIPVRVQTGSEKKISDTIDTLKKQVYVKAQKAAAVKGITLPPIESIPVTIKLPENTLKKTTSNIIEERKKVIASPAISSKKKVSDTISKLKKDVYAKASAKASAEGKTIPPLESIPVKVNREKKTSLSVSQLPVVKTASQPYDYQDITFPQAQVDQVQQQQEPVEEKSGISTLLPILAVAALPFVLGE